MRRHRYSKAGLDTNVFYPQIPWGERPIDVGYRSDESPIYLGHMERRQIADYFLAQGPHYGLNMNISLKQADRFAEAEWAAFLNQARPSMDPSARVAVGSAAPRRS